MKTRYEDLAKESSPRLKSDGEVDEGFVRIRERRRGEEASDRRIDRSRGREFVKLRNRQYARRHLHYSPVALLRRRTGRVVKLQIADWKFSGYDHPAFHQFLRKACFPPTHPPAWPITPATRLVVAYHPPGARFIRTIATFPINPCHLE